MPTMDQRSYVAGNFMLVLDGKELGFLKSVDGGAVTAEVISEPGGSGAFIRKHLGPIRYEEFCVQLGLSMDRTIYDWIAATWQMDFKRKNGSIIAADYNQEAKGKREFSDALISEVTIPRMDGSDKDPVYLTIKIQPERIQQGKASGKVSAGIASKQAQKTWLPSNFKLQIDGLDCSKVNKVDSFTVKVGSVTDDIGDARDYAREPGKLEFPNLKISLSEVSAQSWIDWHEDFVIKGNNGEAQEKSGSLTFLSPNQKMEMATIKFSNLGIFKLGPEKSEAHGEQIKRMTAELYCERMEFQIAK